MSDKYNVLKKNTIIFTIGNVGSSLISFLLIPLFTNYLTTSEYGKIDFVTMMSTLFITITTINLTEALIRFGVDKKYNKQIVISTIMFAVLSIHLVVISIISVLVYTRLINKIIFFYWFLFFIVSIYQLIQQYIRVVEKLKIYAIADILYTLLFSIMNIIFIVKYRMGIKGYFISYISAYIIVGIFLIILGKLCRDIKISLINFQYFKEFLIYCIPLIPNSLSWWIISLSDRYLIKVFIGYSALGVYSVANKIPQIITTFYHMFLKAWQISSIKELGKADTEEFYTKIFKYLYITMFSIGISILLFMNLIFYIMIGEEFKDAVKFVPILILAIIFYTLASFMGTIYTAHKKSRNILRSTIISALINIVINIICIPRFGVMVACISTLLSYFTLFIYRYYDSKKFMKIKGNFNDLIISTIIFVFMIININIFKLSYKAVLINIFFVAVYSIFNINNIKMIIKYMFLKVNYGK